MSALEVVEQLRNLASPELKRWLDRSRPWPTISRATTAYKIISFLEDNRGVRWDLWEVSRVVVPNWRERPEKWREVKEQANELLSQTIGYLLDTDERNYLLEKLTEALAGPRPRGFAFEHLRPYTLPYSPVSVSDVLSSAKAEYKRIKDEKYEMLEREARAKRESDRFRGARSSVPAKYDDEISRISQFCGWSILDTKEMIRIIKYDRRVSWEKAIVLTDRYCKHKIEKGKNP